MHYTTMLIIVYHHKNEKRLLKLYAYITMYYDLCGSGIRALKVGFECYQKFDSNTNSRVSAQGVGFEIQEMKFDHWEWSINFGSKIKLE